MLIRDPVNSDVRTNSKILSPRTGRDLKDLLTGVYDGMKVYLIGNKVDLGTVQREGRINRSMIGHMADDTVLGSGWKDLQWSGIPYSPEPVKQFKY